MRIPDIRHCGRLPAPEDNQARNKDASKVDAVDPDGGRRTTV